MKTALPGAELCFEVFPFESLNIESKRKKTKIYLPIDKLKALFNSSEEGFKEIIKIDPSSELVLLFQKDYVCIGREETLNIGLFPNPKITDGTC